MSPSQAIVRKFNPGVLQSDEEVVAQFVVRQRELGILMDVLRGNIASSSCQHMLVIAPRGRGKTTMLARIAAELRANEELRREFLPVRFMEESYEVFDLADFWLDVLLYLAPEVARHDAETADLLRQAHAEFSRRPRGQEVEEGARTVALETAQRLGRKLVLMVENCQSLFEDVDERFGWGLRKTLQTEPNVMFLGTATARMAALSDVEAPFYEFFRTLLLAPLPLRECKVLWEAVSGEARAEREIRPLQILTGGDPRLLAIVAGLARHRSLRELLQELVALIDDHTEYFRSHLDHLGKTERRVYVALIDLWRPSTTAEVAARARQEIRVTSSLLGRLVKRGAVGCEGKGQKRLYQATQPLYSIYYKLRRQRDEAAVVHGLVHWMVACFTNDELSAMEGNLIQEAAQSASIREGFRAAFRVVPAVRTAFASAAERIDADEARALTDAAMECMDSDPQSAIGLCEKVESQFGKAESLTPYVALALLVKGHALGWLDRRAEEIATYDDLLGRHLDDDAPALRRVNCTALASKVVALGATGNFELALMTFSELDNRFGRDDLPAVQAQVAMALCAKGLVYEQLDRRQEALAAWDQVMARYDGKGAYFYIPIAGALIGKAIFLARTGEAELALAVTADLVQRFGDNTESEVKGTVAKAIVLKADLEVQLHRPEDALSTINERIDGLAASIDPKELQWMEWTRARALLVQGKREAALEALAAAYNNTTIDEETPGRLLHHLPELIGCGLAAQDLLTIFTKDARKSAAMAPMIALLRLRNNEQVRVPAEVLATAQDLAKRLYQSIAQVQARVRRHAARRGCSRTPPNCPSC